LLALLQKGIERDPELIPAKTAVKTATIYGAKVLGMEHAIGSIEAGKQADIVILDTSGPRYCPQTDLLNHFVYSGCDADVVFTMVAGHVLYENGRITFADMDEIRAGAQRCAQRMITLAGGG
jgi:5-methylthioadenosine/S-adenosylhomocysteine deaminase